MIVSRTIEYRGYICEDVDIPDEVLIEEYGSVEEFKQVMLEPETIEFMEAYMNQEWELPENSELSDVWYGYNED